MKQRPAVTHGIIKESKSINKIKGLNKDLKHLFADLIPWVETSTTRRCDWIDQSLAFLKLLDPKYPERVNSTFQLQRRKNKAHISHSLIYPTALSSLYSGTPPLPLPLFRVTESWEIALTSIRVHSAGDSIHVSARERELNWDWSYKIMRKSN